MSKIRRFTAFLLAVVFVFFCTACGTVAEKPSGNSSQSSTPEVVDFPVMIGDTKIEQSPKAIISLTPTTTEMLYALGYETKLMGISDYCDYPAEVDKKLRCGSVLKLNRKNISLRPCDLVVTATPLLESDLIWFQQQGIPVIVIPRADTLDKLFQNYIDLATAVDGKATGREIAEQYIAVQKEKIIKAQEHAKSALGEKAPMKAILLREMSYKMATGDTFEGQLLETVGFVNDAKKYTNWLFPQADVAALEPDVIFVSDTVSVEEVEKSVVYKVVAAAKNHKVMNVDFAIFERQSPRLFDLLLEMVQFAYSETT